MLNLDTPLDDKTGCVFDIFLEKCLENDDGVFNEDDYDEEIHDFVVVECLVWVKKEIFILVFVVCITSLISFFDRMLFGSWEHEG